MVAEKLIPGASWSFVTEDGAREYYDGRLGVGETFSKPVAAGLFYDIASLTKLFVTTRILQLIDAKHLNFNSKVNKIIPEFSNLEMSAADLMLHRGGFPADFSDKTLVNDSFVQNYFINHPFLKSSETTVYSDIGFILLGKIINALDGDSLENSFKTHIFNPLEMFDTTYHLKNPEQAVPTEITKERGAIRGTAHDSKAFRIKENIGSAGLFSTLIDMNKFVTAIITKKLFSQDIYEALSRDKKNGRTYGWETPRNREGEEFLFHTGFTGTSIGVNLNKKRGFILLTNRVHPTREDTGFIERRRNLYLNYF